MSVKKQFKNLSASNVNEFIEYRSKWYLSRILKIKMPGSADMVRGNAVEGGIAKYLIAVRDGYTDFTIEKAIELAEQIFKNQLLKDELTDEDNLIESLGDLVKAGIEALKPYGTLVSYQDKITGTITPEFDIEWVGYIDYIFANETDELAIVDLKVTKRTPSDMPAAHARAGTTYSELTNIAKVDFVYLIPLKKEVKVVIFPLVDKPHHLAQLRLAVTAMDSLLMLGADSALLRHAFMPAFNEFWIDDKTKVNVKRIWGAC